MQGDILNAIIPALDAAGIEIMDGSVDDTGLTVQVNGQLMRIAFVITSKNVEMNQEQQFSEEVES